MASENIRVCFWTSEPDFGELLGRALGAGYEVGFNICEKETTGCCNGEYDCMLLDLRDLPAGVEAVANERHIEKFRQADFAPPIIVLLGDDDPAVARLMMEGGAYDVLINPPDIVELRTVLRRAHRQYSTEKELRQLRSAQTALHRFDDLVGFSENMQEVFSLARKVAPCDVNVLITGRNGNRQEHVVPRPASPEPAPRRSVHRLLLRQSAGTSGGRRALWA